MLATISGVVAETLPGSIIIEVQGIGYEVRLAASELEEINLNQEIKLYLHEHIREDSHDLYGFSELPSKVLFEQLISVSGVGPKVAISILSQIKSDQLQLAISEGKSEVLQVVSGVGKKMAARIIVELKGKLSDSIAGQLIDERSDTTYQALKQLGFSAEQARLALSKTDHTKTEEERLRLALKELGSK